MFTVEMVRNYKRKTSQQKWVETDMSAATLAVRDGRMSFQEATEHYEVPCTTLFRRAKKEGEPNSVSLKQLGRFRKVFSNEEELDLVNHCLFMEKRFFGLRISDLRYLAYQFAQQNNKAHAFNAETGRAGKDWVNGFLKRHPQLSLRCPENTSLARASAFNRQNVKAFFDLLIELFDKFKFPASRVYNVDETGISTVPNKPSKIISLKGKKQVGNVTSAERGVTTTAAICFNAAGQYVPPLLIFPRTRENIELLNGTPPETVLVCHPSGWMQTEIFFPKWFEHFLHYSKPSATDPVLLILDGHATHTKNVQLIEAARQNHVHILCIPPHTSHRLQPLDVSFMFPLSTFHTQECETWMRQNPGRAITIRQVGSIFGKSYLKASTPQNAINGFKKTGIFPLDPNVFPEEAFAASETTDRDLDADAVTIQDAVFHATENPVVDKTSSSTTNVMQDINVSPITVDSNCASCSNVSSSSPTQTIPPDSNVASCSGLQTPIFKKISKNNYVSPIDIMPAPKVKSTCETRKVSKNRGKTAVLTSSPYLKELQEKKGQKVSKRKVVETKLPKQKKPRKGTKGQNKKNTEPISSDEEVEDTSCIVCDGTFLKSKEGEGPTNKDHAHTTKCKK
ncbi:hypothetical protein PPYR_04341 [Photinus pyralis]|uniref:HTH CENPB-type domain-containing protein n=1 Tax=Photinus pyralis TaxID=7054 RepID=A0A5N4AXR4_PHOPY|nr:hypothetical protein PPYR_04341 [Photinus pyralis]